MILTKNKTVMDSLKTVGLMFGSSYDAQYKLYKLLADKKWIRNFLETNCERMRRAKSLVIKQLEEFDIKVNESNSGFYLWLDMRKIFKTYSTLSFQNELKLFELIFEAGVYVVPGQFLDCHEPGYFRLIFTIPDECIYELGKRFKSAFVQFKIVAC